MNEDVERFLIGSILGFCRVGGCFMLIPAIGSARVPASVRLLLVIAASASLAPFVVGSVRLEVPVSAAEWLMLIGAELAVGVTLGFATRCFLLSAQFGAVVAANAIGIVGVPGVSLEDHEASIPLSALLSAGAAAAFVAADLHMEVIRALVESYSTLPPGAAVDGEWTLRTAVTAVGETSILGLRLAAPVLVYAVTVNVALGLAGRLTPRLQVYFISTGVVMIGGLIALATAVPDWIMLFVQSCGERLRSGLP